jgi:hypothetical protein
MLNTKTKSRARAHRQTKRQQKSRHIGLSDLARFTIHSIQPISDQQLELRGGFTHLTGVRLSKVTDSTVGFLYVSRKDSVYLQIKKFDPNSRTAVFAAWPSGKTLRVGDSYPYVDYYWSPKDVSLALEPASKWKRVLFKAQDAVRYRDPKVPEWWKSHLATAPASEGATDVHIVRDGWDHEHCCVCKSRIGRAGARHGYYSKADNDWLCISCYKKFIAGHDLRFLQFKK